MLTVCCCESNDSVFCNADDLEDMLRVEEKKKHGRKWVKRARELMKYRDENGGRCDVPMSSPSLGGWVGTQRTLSKSSMSAERINILDALGFVWNWDDLQWNKLLGELKEYKKEHGHCLVPNRYNDNPKLGTWVQHQRTQYQLMKKGKKSKITKERVEKLKESGFVWKPKRGPRQCPCYPFL